MRSDKLKFRVHALQRIFQRNISIEDVRYVLTSGEVIEDYPEDEPYPSFLILDWRGTRLFMLWQHTTLQMTKSLS